MKKLIVIVAVVILVLGCVKHKSITSKTDVNAQSYAMFVNELSDEELITENPSLVVKKPPQTVKNESAEQVSEENESETEAVFEGEVDVLTNRLTSEDNEYSTNEVSLESAENSINDNYEVLTNWLTPTDQGANQESTKITEEGVADKEWVAIEESEECTLEYKPSIGGKPNPFDNDISTVIEDRPVEDYISEGEDRPGEGIHF